MKRKKDIEMRAVYAGPEFFRKKAMENKRNGGEYPNNYLEDETDTEINDVYGGPGMMGEICPEDDDAPMEAVYAGPEPEGEPLMEKVYAGPGPVCSSPKAPKDGADPAKDGRRLMMKGVYACPAPPVKAENDGPRRPSMMLVYAGPVIRPGMDPGAAKPMQPIAPGAKRFCPVCGTPAGERANFCMECGARLPKEGPVGDKPKLRPDPSKDNLLI